MVRRGEPLSSVERGRSPVVGRGAHSAFAGSPRVAGPPPTQPTEIGCVNGLASLDLADRPAEPGQLAGGGDGDQGAAFGSRFESGPGAVQP